MIQPNPTNVSVLGVSVTLALYTTTESNTGGHYMGKAKRAKAQQTVVREALRRMGALLPPLPVRVVMTRIGRKLLDSDNLPSSTKHIRDSIADVYGVDDADPRYDWQVEQDKGKTFAVKIEIEPATEGSESQ